MTTRPRQVIAVAVAVAVAVGLVAALASETEWWILNSGESGPASIRVLPLAAEQRRGTGSAAMTPPLEYQWAPELLASRPEERGS
jgi:hypothetical protein